MLRGRRAIVAGLLAPLVAAGSVWAQEAAGANRAQGGAESRAAVKIPVHLTQLRTMRVTPRGPAGDDGAFSSRACNVVASHTDANFDGGNFTVQAGFSQGEMFAATYTVPAADWPIRHNLTEVIVATSGSVVTTTTQWSLLFYEGEPSTGTLVATYSSDGDILPHIEIPPGTNGVNLNFSIDPGDPEQLVLNDNGPQLADAAIERIRSYAGSPAAFATVSELEQYFRTIYKPYGWLSDAQWRRLTETSTRRLPDGRVTPHYDPAMVMQFTHHADDYRRWDEWDTLDIPVLCLRGEASDLLLPETAEAMRNRGPRAVVVEIAGCGHAPALNTPEQFALVERFFAG